MLFVALYGLVLLGLPLAVLIFVVAGIGVVAVRALAPLVGVESARESWSSGMTVNDPQQPGRCILDRPAA